MKPSPDENTSNKGKRPPPPPKKPSKLTCELTGSKSAGSQTCSDLSPNPSDDGGSTEAELQQNGNQQASEEDASSTSPHGDGNSPDAEAPSVTSQQPGESLESSTEAATVETQATEEQNTTAQSDTTTTTSNDQDEEKDQLVKTGIGRIHPNEKGEKVIDEAEWETLVERDNRLSEFKLVIRKDGRKRDKLSIMSSYLKKVFRRVVKYFPEVVLDNESISFSYPYAPLYFYYQDIIDYADNDNGPDAMPDDVTSLRLFYDKWVREDHESVRATLASGLISFDNLWALFKPGDFVYTIDEFEQPALYMMAASVYRNSSDELISDGIQRLMGFQQPPGRFVIDAWRMEWDGSTRTFSRKTTTMKITVFSGTRSISSLEFYPLSHYKNGDKEKIAQLLSTLKDRGMLWRKLLIDPPSCWYHDGPAKEIQPGMFKTVVKEKTSLTERVIVDHDGFNLYSGDIENRLFSMMSDAMGPMSSALFSMAREPPVQGSGFDDEYTDFDHIPVDKPFNDLQAQVSLSTLKCCVLRSKKWFNITVENLNPVLWKSQAFDHLVLEGPTKNTLRGLVQQHKKSKTLKHTMSDVIPSKGQGLVIVLHGPPGVGKTLTAESVAEYTHKPLFSINIGDLTADNQSRRLEDIFSQASRWDAVLLLDEADVVLEKRSFEDVKRNGIVSVFLRMLEYYPGVIFLTTNRIGTMDIAFQSRISIAIKYRTLGSDMRRRIWENFIGLLDDSEADAKRELTDNLDEIQEWPLNGRQIRNVLTMAQSISITNDFPRRALSYKLIEEVAGETLKFQDYFEDAYRESRSRLSEIPDRQFKERKTRPHFQRN